LCNAIITDRWEVVRKAAKEEATLRLRLWIELGDFLVENDSTILTNVTYLAGRLTDSV